MKPRLRTPTGSQCRRDVATLRRPPIGLPSDTLFRLSLATPPSPPGPQLRKRAFQFRELLCYVCVCVGIPVSALPYGALAPHSINLSLSRAAPSRSLAAVPRFEITVLYARERDRGCIRIRTRVWRLMCERGRMEDFFVPRGIYRMRGAEF